MKAVLLIFLTLLQAGCDSPKKTASESPASPSVAVIPVDQQKPADRAFDQKLATIHHKWMGTAWTFNGHSTVPKEGSIACGYFVTTTLRDAGIKLNRIRLAQAASETMILAIVPKATVRRYSDRPIEKFLTSVRQQGEGYYIVGLDLHTGFLRVDQRGKVTFVHSGPGRGVVVENAETNPELVKSRYRVTGKLSASLVEN